VKRYWWQFWRTHKHLVESVEVRTYRTPVECTHEGAAVVGQVGDGPTFCGRCKPSWIAALASDDAKGGG
jgi:hypothetical protein